MTKTTFLLHLTLLSLSLLLPGTLALPAPAAVAPIIRSPDFASDFAAVLAAARREADFSAGEEGEEEEGAAVQRRDAVSSN